MNQEMGNRQNPEIVNYAYTAKSKYLNKKGEVCEYTYIRKSRYVKKERSDEKVKRNFIRSKLKTLTEEQINQIYKILTTNNI